MESPADEVAAQISSMDVGHAKNRDPDLAFVNKHWFDPVGGICAISLHLTLGVFGSSRRGRRTSRCRGDPSTTAVDLRRAWSCLRGPRVLTSNASSASERFNGAAAPL
jgi:hypothetical protein